MTTYQGSCCDTPPESFCTLCENGSTDYSAEKLIPRNPLDPNFDTTCQDLATRDRYLSDGSTPGLCSVTARERSRAWCECPGAQPSCSLTCADGNPPSDLALSEPIRGETCERLVYEYTTLTSDECLNPALALNFDARAFCCPDVPTPNGCSICPLGQIIEDDARMISTEFFGKVSCRELQFHASFLPAGRSRCEDFLTELEADEGCCGADPDATLSPTASPDPDEAFFVNDILPSFVIGVAVIMFCLQ